jgi:glycosyltransferase involved in cell wall biosynthesis
MNILFVYDHEYPQYWRDGLWAALELISKEHTVNKMNLQMWVGDPPLDGVDFILGWGAFGSPVDKELRKVIYSDYPKGLCIAGNALPPVGMDSYDVLFHETAWYKSEITAHKRSIHAFGVNKQIYHPDYRTDSFRTFDVLSVGSFSIWKRHHKVIDTPGAIKLVIGQIQQNNPRESAQVIGELMQEGVMVCDMVSPEDLARLYNAARLVYIPAQINGGGERAVLEARACGVNVKVCDDNPKLQELTVCPVWDEVYYKNQLLKGIIECLTT